MKERRTIMEKQPFKKGATVYHKLDSRRVIVVRIDERVGSEKKVRGVHLNVHGEYAERDFYPDELVERIEDG
jgi:hypothetical protein